MSDTPETPAFPYTVEVAGITYEVLAPEGEPGYRVRLPDGGVTAFPSASGDPSPDNAEADIAYALANPPAPVVAVPQEISRPRFMIGLRKVLGLTEGAVFALISQIEDEETQEDVRDWFEHGTMFARSDHWLNLMAQAQGVTSAQLDQVFIVGAAA